MEKKTKILIFCRIRRKLFRDLCSLQVNELKVSAIQNHMITVSAKKFLKRKWTDSFKMSRFMTSIIEKETTVFFVNYSTRISVFPDTYDELDNYCYAHDVIILKV